jgi:hypothetical protein
MKEQAEDSCLPSSSIVSSVVKDILGKVVAKKLPINYTYQNSAFAYFCHQNDKLQSLLIELWFIEWLDESFATPSAQKRFVQECFFAMSPEDDNCPFILLNLTVVHLSNFL